ncbi:73_t:CDS:2 [Entrophospora sp. SA101]|nr:73_t:CDS:2 [Entrophospora sp. SA101]CAJ0915507.1 17850_t:CDS:2 [Entrophospora sp. SA101]
MDPEILLYVNKAQLCDDEARLLFNPPCQLYLQIIGFISPNPNNVNSIDIPKSQNAFLLYRKNYAAKRKSLGCRKNWKIISKEAGDAWKKESDKVTSYFNILARLALEKHKSIYEISTSLNSSPSNSSTSFLPRPISSDYNTLPINYNNNVINKTNALLQSTQFDITTNLNNGENLLEEFQRFLQDEQTDTPSNGADFWRLAGVFCHKMNSKLGQLICIQDLVLTS